jgi:hypothetical protein
MRRMQIQLQIYFIFELGGVERTASRPRPLYPRRPKNMKLGGLQRRSSRYGEKKTFLFQSAILGGPARD